LLKGVPLAWGRLRGRRGLEDDAGPGLGGMGRDPRLRGGQRLSPIAPALSSLIAERFAVVR